MEDNREHVCEQVAGNEFWPIPNLPTNAGNPHPYHPTM